MNAGSGKANIHERQLFTSKNGMLIASHRNQDWQLDTALKSSVGMQSYYNAVPVPLSISASL